MAQKEDNNLMQQMYDQLQVVAEKTGLNAYATFMEEYAKSHNTNCSAVYGSAGISKALWPSHKRGAIPQSDILIALEKVMAVDKGFLFCIANHIDPKSLVVEAGESWEQIALSLLRKVKGENREIVMNLIRVASEFVPDQGKADS
jgi:hypothetical protein